MEKEEKVKSTKKAKKKKKFFEIKFKKPTKKELEIQKKVFKLNKFTKFIILFFILCIVWFFINNTIMYFSEEYAYFYTNYISNTKNGLLFWLYSFIPYANFTTIILFIITIFISGIFINNEKLSVKQRNTSFNCYLCILMLFSYLFIYCVFTDSNYQIHLPNLDTILFEDTKDKSYTIQDLINLNYYLKDKLIDNSYQFKRDDNGKIITDENLNKLAINDLHNISDQISLLNGLYPARSNNINDFLKGFYGARTTGVTTSFTTYFDYSASPVGVLNTITHEYCHTKGFLRENETVYCSFLAGVESKNPLSNYSAYFEAFSRSNYALAFIEPETAYQIEYEALKMCLNNNYSEFCEIYTKNNNEFIPGSEELLIKTYNLIDYNNYGYTKEFVNAITILKNNGAKFYINDKELTFDDVLVLLNDNSNDSIRISLELEKDTYNKISDAISNDVLFIAIYQIDLDEEDLPEINDPVNFFLSPFPTNDDKYFANLSYGSEEYTYERASRLFLEYYDKNGYN